MPHEIQPDRPLGRNLDAVPAWENDRALRYTWLRKFRDQDAARSLEPVADLMLTGSRDDGDTRDELSSVAEDLDSLRLFLAMTTRGVDEAQTEESERELCRRARSWETRLRSLVADIRSTVAGEAGPGGAAAAASIFADLEVLIDRVREAVGPRGDGPESRALRRALSQALAHLVEAETHLAPAIDVEVEEVE